MDSKKIVNADFIIGVVTLIFCGVWIVLGLRFPPGTQDGVPGCGTFPIIVSVILAVMALMLTAKGFLRPTTFFGFTTFARDNLIAIIGTFVVLGLYLVAWYHAGYMVATFFMTLTLGLLYRVGWKTVTIFSVLFSVSTYYIFGKFFMIYMELH